MALTVLQVAFPLATVAPDAVGGAEQICSQLDRALVAEGHRSIVVAASGSRVAGTHVETLPVPDRLDDRAWIAAHEAYRAAIRSALARFGPDVVHMHGVDFDHYLPPPGPPTLVTLHLRPGAYSPGAFGVRRPGTYLHCVSGSQRALLPAGIPLLDEVWNGVDLDRYHPAPRRHGYALALGRICEEKGFHLALEAARRAGVPMLLAGSVHPYPEHVRYFEEQVRPRLDPSRRFLGEVGGPRKRRLLAGARCVVVSSLVPETCSLVALEALACGTPVVALRRGALTEIVEHGHTGFLVDTVDEMAEAIRAAASLATTACRAAAERRFSVRAMARRYLELYHALAGLTTRPARAPAAPPAPPHATGPR